MDLNSKFGNARRCPLIVLLFAFCCGLAAQSTPRSGDLTTSTPLSWAEAATANEERIINDDGNFPLRYRMRKIDDKGDTTRELVETRQGTVARLVQRNGQPLTHAEDAAERERLNAQLASPSDFAKHHKRDNAARTYSLQLVREMPRAMIYTYAPGQPQLPSFFDSQVVLDFSPDPHYHPTSLVTQALTGLQGRVWIDRKSQHVLRIEGRVLNAVDFGWGMLARIFPGGTIEFEQANAGGDRWTYAHLREDITIREMMVKTVRQHAAMDAADFRILPTPLSYQEAIHLLLAMPIPLQ